MGIVAHNIRVVSRDRLAVARLDAARRYPSKNLPGPSRNTAGSLKQDCAHGMYSSIVQAGWENARCTWHLDHVSDVRDSIGKAVEPAVPGPHADPLP